MDSEGPKNNSKQRKKAEIEIRQMEIDDVSSVYHLGEKLFTSDAFPFLYRTWDQYEVTENFTSDHEYCLVAEADEMIVGFILAYTIEKEGTAWKKYGYVSWIGVDEDFQRTNLGIRLYRKLEDRLQEDGVRMMLADTDAENKKAVSFFQKIGFSVNAEHVWLAKTLQRQDKKNNGK